MSSTDPTQPPGHDEPLPEGVEAAPPGVRTMAMVRWVLIGLMAVTAVAAWVYFARTGHEVAERSEAKYVCPMHPSVLSERAGKLPDLRDGPGLHRQPGRGRQGRRRSPRPRRCGTGRGQVLVPDAPGGRERRPRGHLREVRGHEAHPARAGSGPRHDRGEPGAAAAHRHADGRGGAGEARPDAPHRGHGGARRGRGRGGDEPRDRLGGEGDGLAERGAGEEGAAARQDLRHRAQRRPAQLPERHQVDPRLERRAVAAGHPGARGRRTPAPRAERLHPPRHRRAGGEEVPARVPHHPRPHRRLRRAAQRAGGRLRHTRPGTLRDRRHRQRLGARRRLRGRHRPRAGRDSAPA